MPTNRSLRVLKQRAWWVSTKTLLHIFSVLIIVAIFIIENNAVDSIAESSQVRADFPSSELGRDLGEHAQSERIEHKVQGYLQQPGTQSEADSAKIVSSSLQKDRSLASNSTIANGGVQNETKSSAEASTKELQKQMEQKAMESAVKKRMALEARKARQRKEETENSTLNHSTSSTETGVGGKDSYSSNETTSARASFRGVLESEETADLFKTENVTYLSFMLYRLVKTHNMTSLVDIPCTSSIKWMPQLLERLEYEIPRFHYRCIVPDDEYLVDAVLRYKDLSSATVVKDQTYWASILPKADAAFVWYGVGYLPPHMAWQLIKNLRQSRTKYVIMPSFPNTSRNPSAKTTHGKVNVRKPPYLFDDPLRVVKNISTTPGSTKDLLLYTLDGVRSGVIR